MVEQTPQNEKQWPTALPGTQVRFTLPARLELLPVLGAGVREYCASLPYLLGLTTNDETRRLQFGNQGPAGYSHFVYSAELILQEAASNIIRHGYHSFQGGQFLELGLGVGRAEGGSAFLMELRDAAPPFDPTKALWREPDPLEPRESGYGIYLIRKLTDGFSYHYQAGCNFLRMLKYVKHDLASTLGQLNTRD